MKKIFIKLTALSLCVLSSAMLMTACGDNTTISGDENLSSKYKRTEKVSETFNYNDGPANVPNTYNSYISEITDYELKLFRNIYKNKGDNNGSFVTAPINSVLQLSLVANGASKDTQKEIVRTISDDLKLEDINQCSSYFKSRIEAVANLENAVRDELSGKKIINDENCFVKLNNTLVFNNNSDVKTKFLQTNANYYGADIFRLNFDDANSLTKLNNSLTDYTKNAFDSLDYEDRMFSVTASDIYDRWLDTYAQSDISDGVFMSSKGETDVKYMTSNESYMHTDNAVGVVKYMLKTPLKLVVIMPNESISLDEYIGKLTNAEYSELFDSIDVKTKATAKIPEFSINSEQSAVSLNEPLTKSGLYTLFSEDAEFSGITSSDGFVFNNMYEVAPQVVVSAGGIGGMRKNDDTSLLSQRVKELEKADTTVEFNRPFLFMVIDNESSIPLYIGTVDITE